MLPPYRVWAAELYFGCISQSNSWFHWSKCWLDFSVRNPTL